MKNSSAAPVTTLAERIGACASWGALISLLCPGVRVDPAHRAEKLPLGAFDDPMTCRLYDALLEEARAAYFGEIVGEVRQLAASLPVGATLVDVGCGTGRLLVALAQDPELKAKQLEFVGLDPSPEMIAIAKERAAAAGEREQPIFIRAISADQESRALLRKAALVVCRNVLCWVAEPMTELGVWAHELSPSARVYLRELRRDLPFEACKQRILDCLAFKARGVTLAYPPAPMLIAYLRSLTESELHSICDTVGFHVSRLATPVALRSDRGMTSQVEMTFLLTKKE